MANCLNLSTATVRGYICGAPVEALGEIVEAKIIPASAVTSVALTGRTLSWVLSGKGVTIQGANNAIVLNIATKGGEAYNLAYDPTITVVAPAEFYFSAPGGGAVGDEGFLVALKFSNNRIYVVGAYSPLSVISIEGASNVNQNATLTFGVDDWQSGTTIYSTTTTEYDKA